MIIAKEIDTVERRRLFKQLAAIAHNGTLIFAQLLHVSVFQIFPEQTFNTLLSLSSYWRSFLCVVLDFIFFLIINQIFHIYFKNAFDIGA